MPYAGGCLLRNGKAWSQFQLARVHMAGHVFLAGPLVRISRDSGTAVFPASVLLPLVLNWVKAAACLWLLEYRGEVSFFAEYSGVVGVTIEPPPYQKTLAAVADVVSAGNDDLLVEQALSPATAVPVLRGMCSDLLWGLGYEWEPFAPEEVEEGV